jgi:uncharacterized protein (DUF302 family)
LYWVVDVPERGLDVSADGRSASLRLTRVEVIDQPRWPAPDAEGLPASLDITMRWIATDEPVVIEDPGKQFRFQGWKAHCELEARVEVPSIGFTWKSDAIETSRADFALIGEEANGKYYLQQHSVAGAIVGTQPAVPSADGVISKPSPYSVDETIRRLDEVVRGKGLTVFARIDHRSGASEVGLDMQDEQVLIFGNPRAGTPLMVARPLVGIDLPLRVLVWRASDGRVWASYQDSVFISRRYGLPDGLEKNLAGVAALVDAALR